MQATTEAPMHARAAEPAPAPARTREDPPAPDGLPPDLAALLPGLIAAPGQPLRRLVEAGITTPRELLELDEQALRHSPGIGASRARQIVRALAPTPWRLGSFAVPASPPADATTDADLWAEFVAVARQIVRGVPKPDPDAWPDPDRGHRWLAALDDCGGWQRWRSRTDRDEPYLRREILAAYRAAPSRAGPAHPAPPPPLRLAHPET